MCQLQYIATQMMDLACLFLILAFPDRTPAERAVQLMSESISREALKGDLSMAEQLGLETEPKLGSVTYIPRRLELSQQTSAERFGEGQAFATPITRDTELPEACIVGDYHANHMVGRLRDGRPASVRIRHRMRNRSSYQ